MRAADVITRLLSTRAVLTTSGYDTPIQTLNGLVIGHQALKAPNVTEYLGIPYAQPPVGDLRFAAPKKFEGDDKSTFKASNFSAYTDLRFQVDVAINPVHRSCPVAPASPSRPYPEATDQFGRIIAAFTGSIDTNRSEGCLTLNIWTKNDSKKDKPVIVFFYGGRFTIGTSNTPFYNGAYLANAEDVVVVTLNFRINIFGFSGAPNTAQNVGLLDQRLAVEWVRDNIRNFGGSPDHIVISGQSSAGVAVDYWSYAYADDPIVSGYVETSGNAFSFGLNSNALALEHWYNVSAQLGCGDSGDTLPCMRAISNITALEVAAGKVKPPPNSDPARTPPIFQPTPDGITVFENYKALSEAGSFSRLPFLVGNNNNEAGYYKIPAFSQGIELAPVVWEQFNDGSFTCPIAYSSANHVKYDTPTYRFRYFGDWENLRLYPTSGAYHGTEIEMILGFSEDVSGLPKSEEEKKMEMIFMRAWAAFAEDPKEGLNRKLGWPKYDVNSNMSLIRLGYDNKGEATFVSPEIYDYKCANVTFTRRK